MIDQTTPEPDRTVRDPDESRTVLVEAPTDPEDVKIITLARSALARTAAAQGACVRDTDGRTYAGAGVALPHLSLSAVAVAIAMAVSSGAPGLEAVAVAGLTGPTEDDLAIVGDLPGSDVAVWHVDPRGSMLGKTVLGVNA
jgi:hypothetical protein